MGNIETISNQHGYIVHNKYVDEGISGKSIHNRPQLKQLIKGAKQGLFETVIV
ncbi:hypothetical protein EDM56_14230 [Brevibacillus fluminis]|uniref:Resolvase/invertase-type recombinase catalytic domain-containing protein n=1 Tax=Brevibacillus fluminis TaxID=511487 RepID=A0A3M8DHI2_9BACL|nr:hypothetical protein EDM56_14230 [Brevibacillus fluminis]